MFPRLLRDLTLAWVCVLPPLSLCFSEVRALRVPSAAEILAAFATLTVLMLYYVRLSIVVLLSAVAPACGYVVAPHGVPSSPVAVGRAVQTAPARAALLSMQAISGTVVVTDGTDNFYGSRGIFQALHDHGSEVDRIVAYSTSTANAKKMCISRQARYSGLIDVLEFEEGASDGFPATVGDGTTWLAMNADASKIAAQVTAAKQAGVKRVFIHLSASESTSDIDEAAIKAAFDGSGLEYTVMRTGELSKASSGGGMVVADLEMPVCDEIPIDDAFRFITESLSIPEATGKVFSLCPAADESQLREMRRAGCTRRDEAEALLKGLIKVKTPEELAAEAEAKASGKAVDGDGGAASEGAAEDDGRSEAEIAAAREEEVKELLAKAKQKGIENAKRRAEEEAFKAAARKERLEQYAANMPKDDDDEGSGSEEQKDGGEEGKGDDDGPKGKGSGGGDGKKGDDDDDDDDDGRELALL